MNKKIFDREIAMCQKLYQKKKGCQWGKCADCGVVPLLYKLHKSELIEDEAEVKKLKNKIFGK